MSDLSREQLIRIAEHYYPRGAPPGEGDPLQAEQDFERTPEYARWLGLWGQAPVVERWRALKARWRARFPENEFLDLSRSQGAACYLGLVYFREPLPDGSRRVTRLVGAVSLLAPLYLVYVTTQTGRVRREFSPPELSFRPPEEISSYRDGLAHCIEQEWRARPFPMELADVPLSHLRIGHLNQEQPSLLNAFFLEQLDNLP